ncbi:MAG: aminotransferase class I/II-fold pyridoxal phosphate-dependent enzyme, partial [Dehalococcoidia bacterium]
MKLRGYGHHEIDNDDIAAVTRVLRGDTLTGGPAVASFESALARAARAPHAIACANGTAALHLAAWALGIGPGDTVIVPTLTFLASANAARYVGAEVEFADVDSGTGLMTVETLQAAEQRATARGAGKIAAIVPVHLNGQCVDLAGLTAIAREKGWRVIEDGCHALGSRYATTASAGPENLIGDAALSDAVCFSFHPVKTIAMGEGGAVTTRDASLAERLSRLRNHGMLRRPEAFEYPEQGFDAGGSPN